VSAAARTDWVLPRRTDDARSVGVGDGVFDAFSRRDETLSSTTAARVPGFVNLGNTCYLASSAQLVLGLRSFVEDTERVLRAVARVGPDATPDATASLRGEDEEEDGAFPVTRAALDLMRRRGDVSAAAALSPARLKRAVQRRHPRYEGYEQHDAHEFLGSMLDAMEEETTSAYEAGSGRLLPLVRESATASAAAASAATETNAMDSSPERAKGLGIAVVSSGIVPLHRTSCPTRRAFTGAAAVTLTCATCGDVSTKMESFRHLSLELAPSDSRAAASAPLALQALLARWFAPETVERRCAREGCGGTRAVMARRLLRAPRVLLAHLKRFRAEAPIRIDRDVSRDAAGSSSTAFVPPRMVKDFTSVELPERVSLASFADAGSVRGPPVGFPEASASPFAAAEPPVADEAAAATRAFADDGSSRGAAALAQIGAYRLSGIIAHSGESMRRGHYVAGAYAPASEATGLRGETKRWTTFDDERVCPAGSVGEPAKFDDWTLRNWYVAAFECDC
jgi:ubiquitin carboxyl-terminal hydrolase 26/29/37